MPRKRGDQIPWWEVNLALRNTNIHPFYLTNTQGETARAYVYDQAMKDQDKKKLAAIHYFDRSFVLTKIKTYVLDRLQPELTREEIHELIDEAFDFDLEEYKKEWYKAHPYDG